MMQFAELVRGWRRKLAGVVLGAPIPPADTVWEPTEGRVLKELTLRDMSVGKKVLVELGATRTECGYIPYITGEVSMAGPLPESGFFLSLYDMPDGRIPIRRPVSFIPELFDEPFEYVPNKIVFYNQRSNRFVLPRKTYILSGGAVAVSPDSDVGDDFHAEPQLYVVVRPSTLSPPTNWSMFSMVGKFQFERVMDLDMFYYKLETFLRAPTRKTY